MKRINDGDRTMIWCALKKLPEMVRQWHLRRVTIRQLSQLNEHQLNDIGLSRGEIRSVAGQLARSKPVPDARPRQDLRFSKARQNRSTPRRQPKLRVVACTQSQDLQCPKPCASPALNSPPNAA